MEESLNLLTFAPELDFRGLLLAATIIGALGVLDDVTITQVSAVWELHHSDPRVDARGLYSAGIRIGRDHIASTVNTLVLAYTAAALPTLLLFTQSGLAAGEVLTTETLAVEIVQTMVGSIGLVASVPPRPRWRPGSSPCRVVTSSPLASPAERVVQSRPSVRRTCSGDANDVPRHRGAPASTRSSQASAQQTRPARGLALSFRERTELPD